MTAFDGSAVRLAGPRLVLAPLQPEHGAALRVIRSTPEVACRWPDVDDGFPESDQPGVPRFVVLLRDHAAPQGVQLTPRGMVQYAEEEDPEYRHAGIDLFLDPVIHGHGHGREAVSLLAAYLIDVRGHHRLTIDPAADNARAIACYTAVGFRPVGIMRRYERGPDGTFHDGLLMDLLAEQLDRRCLLPRSE
jgi:aminoglycoside 6'-N-acetyltransferase